jgi:nitrogen regulatory protein PII
MNLVDLVVANEAMRPATFDDIKEILLGMGAEEMTVASVTEARGFQPGRYLVVPLDGEEER